MAKSFVNHDMTRNAKFTIVDNTIYSEFPPAYID